MRVVDFIISLLEAQAQTLTRLGALFGEEQVMQLLEAAPEDQGPLRTPINLEFFDSSRGQPGKPASAYVELEGAVRELKLPEVLEFHLWAYPYYRSLIESSVELNWRIVQPDALVDEAVNQARGWVMRLPLPPEFVKQTERATQVPWVRFRTSVLKRAGKRPLGAVQ